MPKLKTRKAVAKRFSKTGTGKFKYQRANKQHILTDKSPKRKRRLRKSDIIGKTMESNISKMLPYA